MKQFALFILICLSVMIAQAQTFEGQVLNKATGVSIEYVSIGVVGKNVGTVSDADGRYSLAIAKQFDGDSICFSSIGYKSKTIAVGIYKQLEDKNILLEPKVLELREIGVTSKGVKNRRLGNNYANKLFSSGFDNNNKGYELGVLLKIDKPTMLKIVNCHLNSCSYDSLFYRLNVYQVKGTKKSPVFENILQQPIFLSKKVDEKQKSVISFDISAYDITIDDDILVTLEHIKDLGDGGLLFSSNFKIHSGAKSYYRKTSHGIWEEAPVKIGMSIETVQEK